MRISHVSPALLLVMASGCSNQASNPDPTPETTQSAVEPIVASSAFGLTGVPAANTKTAGVSSPNSLSPELMETIVAQGSNAVENPTAVDLGNGSSATVTNYGYDGDGPMVPAPGDLPSATHKVEATKTEPDKNTYLVLNDQTGADPNYDYGSHFLFQGHELGTLNAAGAPIGSITRINLDADGPHRVTLLATTDTSGAALPLIDGSTWDPFAQKLLFSSENGAAGGIWQATLSFPSTVEDISGALGRGGYEGIQNDQDGNLWIVEDSGGKTGTASPHAKQPNSFLYRYVPKHKNDLKQGKLQALQVMSLQTGTPIAFHAGAADADILSADVGDLHTYGKVFDTKWVTIHDTDVDGYSPFNANSLAKAALATPFKRPENGQFRPQSGFREFYFDETGDTNILSEAGAAHGGFGSVLKLVQASPSSNSGKLSLFYLSDVVHSAFDNCAFWSRDHIVFVEDAGDGLHSQRNALDSAYVLDVKLDYSNPANVPVRIIAEGRDPSATIDSALGGLGLAGFQNEGDNEITGIHISDGDPGRSGLLGARIPRPFFDGWRVFYTQQHGENFTWEVLWNPTRFER